MGLVWFSLRNRWLPAIVWIALESAWQFTVLTLMRSPRRTGDLHALFARALGQPPWGRTMRH